MECRKLDIASVIEHYTGSRPYRKMTSCPLHEDKTPSCSVDYEMCVWNCHSCGKAGDGYSLIMEVEGCDFAGALSVAERLGIDGKNVEELEETRFGVRRSKGRSKEKGRGYRPRFARGE